MTARLSLACCFLPVILLLSGCSGISSNFNTATNEQETTFYSTDKEQQIGAAVAQEVEKEYKVVDDPAINERVDRITRKLAAICDRKDLVFVAKVIEEKKETDEKSVNAMSLPGGYVYIFRGLMDYIKDDGELAAVIGHEIGHIAARHSIKRLQASYSNLALILAAIRAPAVAGGLAAMMDTLFFKYSQDDEIQADGLGVKYMKLAGYDPSGMVRMLEALQEYDRKQPIRPKMYASTHPYVHQRIASVNRIIAQDLSFRDWVRLTGEREDYKR
ncbi:MAG: M48 family metalloprotease [Candidatus Omnitrophica bacterium]|nr:M48 family metalloprotease [Candidatus Omnitrophota bacterium]